MTEKAFRQLNIDPEFKNLICPLRREEYRQLELNLVMKDAGKISSHGMIPFSTAIIAMKYATKCAFLMESRSWISQTEMLPSPGSVRTNSGAATSQKKPGNI